jgi:hypothetical protein
VGGVLLVLTSAPPTQGRARLSPAIGPGVAGFSLGGAL